MHKHPQAEAFAGQLEGNLPRKRLGWTCLELSARNTHKGIFWHRVCAIAAKDCPWFLCMRSHCKERSGRLAEERAIE